MNEKNSKALAKPMTIAFEDDVFMKIPECRSVRLQLEFLKPDLLMDKYHIKSTMVIFGSARTKSPEEAATMLNAATVKLNAAPTSPEAQAEYKEALRAVANSKYYQVARELGALVTRESRDLDKTDKTFVIMTGGGGGIMEAGNRGAFDENGLSTGVNITLPFEQHPNKYLTEELSFQMHYFSIRKMHFLRRAKGLACFPGGFGTMDELFEVLTLIQTHKIPQMPVLLYGRDFWTKLINWEYFEECGFISKGDCDIFSFCETAEEGWNKILDFYKIKRNTAEN